MRAILALVLLPVPAAAASPELELQAGWFHGSDFSLDPGAAELALRLAPASWRSLALSLEGALSGWDGFEAAQNPGTFQRPPDAVTASPSPADWSSSSAARA